MRSRQTWCDCATVPEVRQTDDKDHAVTTTFPVLDLSLLRGTDAQRAELLEDLRHAAHDVGFFYVTGHGVADHVVTDVFDAARDPGRSS